MESDEGQGWTVFYRRQDGSHSFAYSQLAYEVLGIGSPADSEFLLPLSNVAMMAT